MSYLYPRRTGISPIQTILLTAGGFAIGLAAAFLLLAPRVRSVSPAAGERTGAYAAIEIRFSVPMDPDCTAARFSVEPAVEGALEIRGDTLRFTPDQPWPAGAAVRAVLGAGACSRRGLPLLAGISWSFTPSLVRVAYIPTGESGNRLMGVSIDGGEPSELAGTPSPIYAFDVSARGDFAVLSTGLPDEPGRLWIAALDGRPAELLLDCGEDSCRDPSISPDGSLVAFVRSPKEAAADQPAAPPLGPFIGLLTVADGTLRILSPADHASGNPTWSAQGWLSYYDETRRAIVVDDLAGGQTAVPTSAGSAWTWLPDGSGLIYPEFFTGQESESGEAASRIYSHLIRADLKTNRLTDLSGALLLEDASPAVSPDGRRLAFSRNYFDARWTPGRQLWIMDLETSAFLQISDSPDYSHSSIRWSPDGARLAFMLFHETLPDDPPEIWCVNADGSDPRQLAVGGYLPHWLP